MFFFQSEENSSQGENAFLFEKTLFRRGLIDVENKLANTKSQKLTLLVKKAETIPHVSIHLYIKFEQGHSISYKIACLLVRNW